jgi:hypothetical protein
MNRRSILGWIFGLLGGSAVAQQKAVLEKGRAVVCDNEPVKCPMGHDSCRVINAPVVVGNDSYQNPDVGQLRDFHLLRCDQCHVLFTLE